MRIRLTKLAAGPQGVRRPGEVFDLNDAEAQALIGGGFATAHPEVETAAAAPPENAARRTGRGGRGSRRGSPKSNGKGRGKGK